MESQELMSNRLASAAPDRDLLRQYVLGQLDESDRKRLEQRCFESDEWFVAALEVEDHLVDLYLRNGLTVRERELFERSVLDTPAGRERLRAAAIVMGAATAAGEALTDAGPAHAPARPGPVLFRNRSWSPWLALAASVALVLASIGAFEIARLRSGIDGLVAARDALRQEAEGAREAAALERARAEGYERDLQQLRTALEARTGAGAAARTLTLSLLPVTTRDPSAPAELVLRPGSDIVVLELVTDPGRQLGSFRVVLEEDGRRIAQLDVAKTPSPDLVTVPLPAYLLTEGESYTAIVESLAGAWPPARYTFRVVRR